VRVGTTLSDTFIQSEGVPQGSVLSVTLFIAHISSIISVLQPSISGTLYVDDLQISCQGSDIYRIQRQLQSAINDIVGWCEQNGHTISAVKSSCVHFCRKRSLHPDPTLYVHNQPIPVVSKARFLGVIFDSKLTFLPHILDLRKRCEKALNILKVLSNTSWGADRTSLLRVYQAVILSRIDYGSVVYGSARASVLRKLDPVHHSALRICTGAFRTSPVQSSYADCSQICLDFRRKQLSANYYFKIMSMPNHPLRSTFLNSCINRLYNARPFNVRPFMDRTKLFLEESALISLDVKQSTFFSFPPWSVSSINYIDPFSLFHKASTAPVVFYQVFNLHRSLYSQYVPVFTDGSKSTNYVGCSVAFPDSVSAYRLNAALSIYTAEATAISCALQRISSENTRQFCIYTDSMSVLQSLQQTESSNNPVICDILLQMEDLRSTGFDILFCWVPSHTGIKGNELADSAAKSALVPLNSAVPLSDVTCFIRKHINKMWQQLWDLQQQNKLHSLKPFLENERYCRPLPPGQRPAVICFAQRHHQVEGKVVWPSALKESSDMRITRIEQSKKKNLKRGLPNRKLSEELSRKICKKEFFWI
ncbi:hypothetical protein AVEN_81317-2-1, partial [Araneus ventricosus]